MASGHRVLVVDDDEAMGIMLLDVLQEYGHEVAAVRGVDEALMRLEAADFTLIVSDVQMDPQSGFDLLEILREREDATPVILMSAFADPALERRALTRGARAILSKPFDPASLLEIVRSVES